MSRKSSVWQAAVAYLLTATKGSTDIDAGQSSRKLIPSLPQTHLDGKLATGGRDRILELRVAKRVCFTPPGFFAMQKDA